MFDYDRSDQPPAAYVTIQVSNPQTSESRSIRAKIDTGASISVLPETLIRDWKLEPEGRVRVGGYDGSRKELPTYTVGFEIAGYPFPNVEVLATQRQDVLLGRDLLNHFILTLDGKNLTFTLVDP